MGVLGSATILGETFGACRFRYEDACALQRHRSDPGLLGSKLRVRLSRSENRAINTALRIAAITDSGSTVPHTTYHGNQIALGKTATEALRLLRRRLSGRIHRGIRADEEHQTEASATTKPEQAVGRGLTYSLTTPRLVTSRVASWRVVLVVLMCRGGCAGSGLRGGPSSCERWRRSRAVGALLLSQGALQRWSRESVLIRWSDAALVPVCDDARCGCVEDRRVSSRVGSRHEPPGVPLGASELRRWVPVFFKVAGSTSVDLQEGRDRGATPR